MRAGHLDRLLTENACGIFADYLWIYGKKLLEENIY